MKITKLIKLTILACTTFSCASCGLFDQNYEYVNVLMVNDNHGVLNEETGGLDKIATGMNQYESSGNTIKIANGDMFQGTYASSSLKGLPMLDALNKLNFDAFVVGNHEFDWGLEEMAKYKDGDLTNGEANFPFLGANIYQKSTGKMVDWLEPYTIVEFDDIKIGIIGVIGNVSNSILSTHVEDYEFVDAREIVKDLATELRSEKNCNAVIVSTHSDDEAFNYHIAEYEGNKKIDGIFSGHSHYSTNKEIIRDDKSKVCVLQNGGYGDSFASLKLKFNSSGKLKGTEGKLNFTNQYNDTGILAETFSKYEDVISIGNEVLLTIDESITKRDIGIEVAHSMYTTFNVDFAVINSGGVRTGIEAGEVTYADLFQILPFENEVYLVTLSGSQLKEYVNTNSNGIYYWGIYLSIINDNQYYQMAIIDFVYVGYTFENYRNNTCINTNKRIRDVFINYLKESI